MGFQRAHVEHPGVDHALNHVVGQIRINRSGAIADQAGYLVRIAGTAGFHNQVGIATQTALAQVVMNGRCSQQRIDHQHSLRRHALGNEQQHLAGTSGSIRLGFDILDGLFKTDGRIVSEADIGRFIARALQMAQVPEFVGRQQR